MSYSSTMKEIGNDAFLVTVYKYITVDSVEYGVSVQALDSYDDYTRYFPTEEDSWDAYGEIKTVKDCVEHIKKAREEE